MMKHFLIPSDLTASPTSEDPTSADDDSEDADDIQDQTFQHTPELYDDHNTEITPEPQPLCFRNTIISQNIGRQALKIAKSITDSSIKQQCK